LQIFPEKLKSFFNPFMPVG